MMEGVADTLYGLRVPIDRVRYERFEYDTVADASSRRAKRKFRLMMVAIALGIIAFAIRAAVL